MTNPSSEHTMLRTTISRNWLIKMAIFLIAMVGFGTWGLVDATVIYPRKGLEDASFKLKAYLQAASATNRLNESALKLTDPAAELAALAARESAQKASKNLGAVKEPLTEVESAKLAWLRSLDRAWKLGAAENPIGTASRKKLNAAGNEIFSGVGGSTDSQNEKHRLFFRTKDGTGVGIGPDGKRVDLPPAQVLKDLTDYWTAQKKTPSSLEFYDMPSQWFFVAVGYGGGIYIVFLLLSVGRRQYQYEPGAMRLVLPSGDSITPGDLKEVDKRRWHKFFVTLVLKNGRSQTLDLLRYVPLEQWVLEMEKKAFPDEAERDEDSQSSGAPGASEVAGVASGHGQKNVGAISAMTYGGVPDGVFAVLLFDDAASVDGNVEYAAYAQAEALKALAAALSKEHGWSLWLTAGAGLVGGSTARVGGGPSLGTRSLAEWIDGKGFGYHVDATRVNPAMTARIQSAAAGDTQARPPYAIVLGRVTTTTAATLHETMLDPATPGYAGTLIVKSNPATIERFTQPLEIEGGLEIKGSTCLGSWKAPAAEIEAAGLSSSESAASE